MFVLLPESTKNSIGFKVSGKLTASDYDFPLSKLDEAIEKYGRINLLLVFTNFDGWESMEAAKRDFKFGTQQYRQVEKAAFQGDKKWQEWMIKIMDPFTHNTTERFFTTDQLDEAWKWIKDDNSSTNEA